jgi:hypothetical protein
VLNRSTLSRLETQLEVIPLLLTGATPEELSARPAPGQWSALENLAHLARHHAVFLERLHRLLNERAPVLARYRAEEESEWPEWSRLSTEEVVARLKSLRGEIADLVRGLTAEEAGRTGIHPLLGEMSLASWVEFFLLHEAHHLYVVMTRLGMARSRNARAKIKDE